MIRFLKLSGKGIKMMMSGQYKLPDIFHFLTGEWRFFIYYGVDPLWLSERVRFTYEYRVEKVRQKSLECIENGHCVVCGCVTPDLFFANKADKGGCYPKMISKRDYKAMNIRTKELLVYIYENYEELHIK